MFPYFIQGEWYFSTHFGDSGVVSDNEWQMRRDVVAALLDAVPSSRSLHIRTPRYKKTITNMDLPLTEDDYRNSNNNASRIGLAIVLFYSVVICPSFKTV